MDVDGGESEDNDRDISVDSVEEICDELEETKSKAASLPPGNIKTRVQERIVRQEDQLKAKLAERDTQTEAMALEVTNAMEEEANQKAP